jgi:hypothetical protein
MAGRCRIGVIIVVPPSPKLNRATNQLFRESSRVANRRLPQKCVKELTIHVACSPIVTRRNTPHRRNGRLPKAASRIPTTTNGT